MAKCVLLQASPPRPPLLLSPRRLLPPPPTGNPFSLYAGDLHPSVNEIDLYIFFSAIGPLHSVHLCIDRFSHKSLRYAYINFYFPFNAADALCRLNHMELKGKSIRLMWCQRDPILRKTGIGNLFVKNLDLSIHETKLEEVFGIFGRILSCKIAKEGDGKSKGFGFVQFDSEDSALDALDVLNGCVLKGKILTVAKYLKKSERKKPQFTNVYVKNLDENFTESSLIEKFSTYGKVTSAVIMNDKEGKSKGFGFVNFESHDNAKIAIEALNGEVIGLKKLYVGKAMMKAARDSFLRRTHVQKTKPIITSNLYVRNLATSVNEKDLREVFGAFGCVVFTKVIRFSNGVSKGIASVCFSKPEDAMKAVKNLNGFCYHGKYMKVTVAMSREEYARRLQTLFPFTFFNKVRNLKPYLETNVQKDDDHQVNETKSSSCNGGFALQDPK
ncbi:polyadenylate-binding protein 6 [Lactuca sativa]|uniref:polyadenylate-binding protein 6 n=1 Tax=Lactuca sativa TaxID=4236 RepID=UPI000CC741B9|nr:polyadenylate-binding protein 6 [Lactuca sativa]